MLVAGIYANGSLVPRAVEALKMAQFGDQEISVLLARQGDLKDKLPLGTKAQPGAAVGAGAGAIAGGVLGLFAGLVALAVPGIGAIVAVGPIVGALTGAGAGGLVGGAVGILTGMGLTEYEARRYEGLIKAGGVLLSVHSEFTERLAPAQEIMERTGAENVRWIAGEVAPSGRDSHSSKEIR